jgi:Transglycosylase SLT domain
MNTEGEENMTLTRTTIRRARRRSRIARWLGHAGSLVAGGLLAGAGFASFDQAGAADAPIPVVDSANAEVGRLMGELDQARGKLAVNQLELDRYKAVARYSTLYQVPFAMATKVYDAALAEDIHPSLGFQLVKVESGFRSRARSSANALGLTQVQLRTGLAYDSTLTERRLLDPDTNLRIGFRILHKLLRQFGYDLELALRAYNLGPTGAVLSLADTTDVQPGSRYAQAVMKGVKGRPTGGR